MTNQLNLVTIKEATEICRVSRRTIYNWIKENKIQYTKIASGKIRIFQSSLVEYWRNRLDGIVFIVIKLHKNETIIESVWDNIDDADRAIDQYVHESKQLYNCYDIIERKLNSFKLPDYK